MEFHGNQTPNLSYLKRRSNHSATSAGVQHILQPNQEFQLKELYDNDREAAQHWDRVVQEQRHATFEFTTKIFTAANNNIVGETENNNVKGLVLMQTDMKDNQTKN